MNEIQLSLFKGYADTCPTDVPFSTVITLLRENVFIKEHTGKYRTFTGSSQLRAAGREKAGTPCFAVAVRFSGGKAEGNICGWTGLGLVDIDHIPEGRFEEVRRLVQEDVHSLLSYTTISGCGLRVLYRIDGLTDDFKLNKKVYGRIFLHANRYYAELTGCECDLKCKNITRLSGLAHDPALSYRPDAEAFTHVAEPKIGKVAVSRCTKVPKRILTAIRKELKAQGAAYVEHQRNDYIMRTGYLLNAYGVHIDVATAWAAKEFDDYDGDVAGILRSCYSHADEHGSRSLPADGAGRNDDRETAATVEQIEAFLDSQGCYRQNVITGKVEYLSGINYKLSTIKDKPTTSDGDSQQWQEVDDRWVNSLWCRMCKQVCWVRANDIRAVLASEFVPIFNPFDDYFKSLPPWDGVTDYITELADTITAKGEGEQAFLRTYFKKWLVATVASMLDSEVVNHEILVLIGPQGCYKTTWMNRLLPPELRRYFYVKSNSNRITKDDLFSLTEFAIICLEEIDELNGSENNQLKALVSKPEVNERVAYGHYKERRPHLASFCATTNNLQFLTDLTGSRRWLPIEVERIASPFDHPVNYSGVYAQAYALVRCGFDYYLSPDEIQMINLRNHRFEVPCLEVELIQMCYEIPMPDAENAIFVTTTRIMNRLSGMVRQLLSPTKIGIAMKKAGFELMKSGGKRGYRVIELDMERIKLKERAMGKYTD